MSENWKPVNMTRREVIDPARVGCRLTLDDWQAVHELIRAVWPSTDDVRAVGDQGGHLQVMGGGTEPWPAFDALDDFVDVSHPQSVSVPPRAATPTNVLPFVPRDQRRRAA